MKTALRPHESKQNSAESPGLLLLPPPAQCVQGPYALLHGARGPQRGRGLVHPGPRRRIQRLAEAARLQPRAQHLGPTPTATATATEGPRAESMSSMSEQRSISGIGMAAKRSSKRRAVSSVKPKPLRTRPARPLRCSTSRKGGKKAGERC